MKGGILLAVEGLLLSFGRGGGSVRKCFREKGCAGSGTGEGDRKEGISTPPGTSLQGPGMTNTKSEIGERGKVIAGKDTAMGRKAFFRGQRKKECHYSNRLDDKRHACPMGGGAVASTQDRGKEIVRWG